MTKKFLSALSILVALGMLSSLAMADSVTFTFAIGTMPVGVTNNTSSLTLVPVLDVVVKNTTGTSFVIPDGLVAITSHNNTGYSVVGGLLTSTYAGQAGTTEVSVTSAVLCGGLCLTGDLNGGFYFAMNGDGGGWAGIYRNTFVSPAILALFGDSGQTIKQNGSDVFTTTNNNIGPGSTSASLGSGSITFQTLVPTPEPGTLPLLGSGFAGLIALIRRRLLP